jgi:arylsulfatase A-like enzyme/MFS family permease
MLDTPHAARFQTPPPPRHPPSALHRMGLAVLLPMLCYVSAAVAPALVDLNRLSSREPGLSWYQLLHAFVFGSALLSLVAFPVGLVLGLLLLGLTRTRDLSASQHQLVVGVWDRLRRANRRPEAAATTYAVIIGAGLLVGLTYKLTHLFWLTFKNQQLAALLMGCLMLVLLGVLAVVTLALRGALVPVLRGLGRVRGIKVLAWVAGALGLLGVAATGVVVYLLIVYKPIVAIIDWRPLSYPATVIGVGTGLLALALYLRGRRLRAGARASRARRVGLAAWCAVILGLWSYCFLDLENRGTLRTTLLRRAYGAARAMDVLSFCLDFDGDGYLSFFGGGDCAPFDEAVNPGASEIPDNGVDDNCFGGDLSLKRLKAPKRRFDHKLPAALVAKKKLNFALITFDGLRADHVGAYGYKRPTTPTIDNLARRSVVFERAYTQAPSTRYSIPSFMTSKYSSQIPRKAITDIPKPILPSALLMAEVLKEAGYRTGAALSYQVFNRSWQMDQGFDFYDNSQATYYIGKGGPAWNKDRPYLLVDAAKRFLEQEQHRPFFLWVHFFEPHPPYVHRKKPRDFGADMVGQYDGELRFADDKLTGLLEAIRRHPAADRTVVMFAADHGRGLGEHGLATHGYDLYVENVHVPLLFYVPGLRPRRIKNPVAMLDLLPTLVNLARIRKQFDFEGESLVPQLVDGVEPDPQRPIFSEVQVGFHNSHVINAITTRDYKLIFDVTYNAYQLYDLRSDPGEKRDVADQRPAELNRMKGLLYKVMERGTLPAMQEEIQSSIVKVAPPTPGVTPVNFGDEIQFLGFTVNPERPRAGDVAVFSWYVKALRRTKLDNKFIIQLKGSRGAFFDAKHVPVRGQYPTTKWVPGQVIRDRQHLRLPPAPQDYEVWVGFGTGHQILQPVGPHRVVNTVVKVGKFTAY